MELHVTPTGIYFDKTKLAGFENLHELLSKTDESDLVLHPFDSFSKSKFPSEYSDLRRLITESKGRLRWGFEPRD